MSFLCFLFPVGVLYILTKSLKIIMRITLRKCEYKTCESSLLISVSALFGWALWCEMVRSMQNTRLYNRVCLARAERGSLVRKGNAWKSGVVLTQSRMLLLSFIIYSKAMAWPTAKSKTKKKEDQILIDCVLTCRGIVDSVYGGVGHHVLTSIIGTVVCLRSFEMILRRTIVSSNVRTWISRARNNLKTLDVDLILSLKRRPVTDGCRMVRTIEDQ
jgi:hypothetical protein